MSFLLDRIEEHRRAWYAGVLLTVVVAPAVMSWLGFNYYVGLFVLIGIFGLLALSMDVMLGWLGHLNLGQHGFMIVGAYGVGIVVVKGGFGVWAGLAVAAIGTALVGLAVGIPSFRVKGHYFAIVTLGFGEIIRLIATNWVSLTEGPSGLGSIPNPAIAGFRFESNIEFYYVVLALTVLVYVGLQKLYDSRVGRAFVAIREDEVLAESMGVRAMDYKLLGIAISGFVAGIGGGLYAITSTFISPLDFFVVRMAEILTMVLVGGAGFLAGPVIGAAIFIPLLEFLREFGQARLGVFGIALILIIIFAPNGVMGLLDEPEEVKLRLKAANRSINDRARNLIAAIRS